MAERQARRLMPHVIDYKGQIRGELAARFAAEAQRRAMEPAALATYIIELVAKDDLFAAVLDD